MQNGYGNNRVFLDEFFLNIFKDWVTGSLVIFGITGIIAAVFKNKIPPGIALLITGGFIGFVLHLWGYGFFLIFIGLGIIFIPAPICLLFFLIALIIAAASAL